VTTKEIALAVNKAERTVQGWAKVTGAKIASIGAKIASVGKSGIPVDYNEEETLAIIKQGMGQNACDLFRMSMNKPKEVVNSDSTLTKRDMELIAGIVTMVMQNMETRVSTIEKRVEERQALLPAPEISPRMHINKLVREYTNKHNEQFADIWKLLYSEYGYRKNYNPVVRANNRNMKTLDYIEEQDGLAVLESVAVTVLK